MTISGQISSNISDCLEKLEREDRLTKRTRQIASPLLMRVQSIMAKSNRLMRKSRWFRKTVLVSLLALFGVAPPTVSQHPGEAIFIGGQGFELGMPKDVALSKLAECCTLSGSGDVFTIEPKHPPYYTSGIVWFAGGKVVRLLGHVAQFREAESVDLGQTLYRSIKELTNSESLRVTVNTQEIEGQGVTVRDIFLYFGNGRSLVLEINKVDVNPNKGTALIGDWVDVNDELEKPQ
jgi:hypothetical protein